MNNLFLVIIIVALNLNFLASKPFHIYNYDTDYKNVRDDKGNYEFKYRTQFTRPEDDAGRSETGRIEKTSTGEDVLRVNGTYHFNPKCYHSITVYYMADENGFRARTVEHFNGETVKKNGVIVSMTRRCGVLQTKRIGSGCLASLQGACAG